MTQKIDEIKKRCDALVVALVGTPLANTWWNGPNKAFENRTPAEQFKVSPDAVYSYLEKSADGEW